MSKIFPTVMAALVAGAGVAIGTRSWHCARQGAYMRRLVILLGLVATGCSGLANDKICSTPEQLSEMLKLPHDYTNQITKVDNCLHRWAFRLAGAQGSINEVAQAAIGACHDTFEVEATLFVVENKMPTDQATTDHWETKFRDDGLDLARFYVAMARAGRCAIP